MLEKLCKCKKTKGSYFPLLGNRSISFHELFSDTERLKKKKKKKRPQLLIFANPMPD